MPSPDIYDAMVLEVARIGRLPSHAELRHALSDAVHHVARALPLLEDPDPPDTDVVAFATQEAHASVTALARCLVRIQDEGAIGTEPAAAAIVAVLDALAAAEHRMRSA